jgi:imidazolonepropionase-like amidohydrolase
VEAGISPLEAITIGTLNAAKYLDREDDLGTIEPGKLADMVLLDADPLKDISNTQLISAVFKGGEEIDRDALQIPRNQK